MLLIRLNIGLSKGYFTDRWTLQQAFDASRASATGVSSLTRKSKSQDAGSSREAAERLGLLCATVNVAANVTQALNPGRLGVLVPSTAAQVRPLHHQGVQGDVLHSQTILACFLLSFGQL